MLIQLQNINLNNIFIGIALRTIQHKFIKFNLVLENL